MCLGEVSLLTLGFNWQNWLQDTYLIRALNAETGMFPVGGLKPCYYGCMYLCEIVASQPKNLPCVFRQQRQGSLKNIHFMSAAKPGSQGNRFLPLQKLCTHRSRLHTEQPLRGAPWVSGLVGHFVQTWPDSECSDTVQCIDCSDLNWRWSRYHLFWHGMTLLVLMCR